MSASFLRVASRGIRAAPFRPVAQPLVARSAVAFQANFSTSMSRRSGDHAEETFEEFSAR